MNLFRLPCLNYVFTFYDWKITTKPRNEYSLGLGEAIETIFIYFSCYMAAIGILGKSVLLYFRHKGKNLKTSVVHLVSLGCAFILPRLF